MKKSRSELNDWSRSKYDRSDLGELVRGKYAKRISESTEREKVESDYHHMEPEQFDEVMSQAKPHSPNTITRPARSRSKVSAK